MKLSMIVAMDDNHLIGLNNTLPWHLPRDLKYFKDTTTGKPVIMGRNTYESIGRLLPNRMNVILTTNISFDVAGAVIWGTLRDALVYLKNKEEVFAIGGSHVFNCCQRQADRLYLTRVHTKVEVKEEDKPIYFDLIKPEQWVQVSEEFHPADENNEHDMTFMVYERI